MKPIDLNTIPYKHRFAGASLLISKANRVSNMANIGAVTGRKADDKALLAGLAYYDMALALLKPFDPNYPTVVNWKCNVLLALRQYEDAVAWYREIVRISDETDGKAKRNATAALAEEMIRQYEGRANEPLPPASTDAGDFDDPPYCMFAEDFCQLLIERKFKKAHALLSPALGETISAAVLESWWLRMTENAAPQDIELTLGQHMVDWPNRKAEAIGWCYFSVVAGAANEAVTVIVSHTPENTYCISEIEFGRP